MHEAATKPAPPALGVVQDFVNTTKRLYGQEGLADSGQLRGWLTARGLLEPGEAVTAGDHREALALREALRALMLANTTASASAPPVEAFNHILVRADLRVRLRADAKPALEPYARGLPGALGVIASTALVAMIDGSWRRLKACANADCRWSFYDRSPSSSGTWCDMAVCGSGAKMRAYRQRRRRRITRAERG